MTNIKPCMYRIIDEELRNEYLKEFNINSNDKTIKIFTFDEQVKRYSDMLKCWYKHLPNDRLDDIMTIAKLFYVKNGITHTLNQINNLDKELRNSILDKCNDK